MIRTLLTALLMAGAATAAEEKPMSVLDFTMKNIDGHQVDLSKYKGDVLLIVNTASKCGFTPQYGELQKIYQEYRDRGLVVLGFPCDQFAHQEPGSEEEIVQFCTVNFGVTFPIFSKVNVNGKDAHPLFKFLTAALPGSAGKKVKWNFTKFLIAPDGSPVKRFAPSFTPDKLIPDIEALLGQSRPDETRE